MSKRTKRSFKYEIGSTVEISEKGRGKIIDRCFDSCYLPYLVEFDKWNDGHDGDTPPHYSSEKKALGKNHYCWWVDEDDIKVISKTTTKTKYTTKYKPGDEVVVRNCLRGRYTMEDGTNEMWVTDQMKTKAGQTVKIKSVTKTGKYMIEGSIFPWVDGMFEKKVEKTVEPKVGDRIRMITDHCNAKTGMTGVILKVTDLGNLAVKFDKKFGGHSCDGLCMDGYGHYVKSYQVEIIGIEKEKKTKKTPKFKVGDKVVAKKTTPYSITTNGWTGFVINVYDDGLIGVEKNMGDVPFRVKPEYFDLVEKEWNLTITGCGDTTTATYTDVDGKTITKTVSRYHGDEFDVRKAVDAVIEKVLPTEKKTYTVAGVTFERGGEVYNYLVNDIELTRNMVVVVPVGKGNTPTHAVVQTVGTYTEDTSPYPISKMKTVEKVEDWDGWKLVCVKSDHSHWTEGKIYRVVDGKFYDDEGDFRTMDVHYRTKWNKDTKELNIYGSRFKRVIEG